MVVVSNDRAVRSKCNDRNLPSETARAVVDQILLLLSQGGVTSTSLRLSLKKAWLDPQGRPLGLAQRDGVKNLAAVLSREVKGLRGQLEAWKAAPPSSVSEVLACLEMHVQRWEGFGMFDGAPKGVRGEVEATSVGTLELMVDEEEEAVVAEAVVGEQVVVLAEVDEAGFGGSNDGSSEEEDDRSSGDEITGSSTPPPPPPTDSRRASKEIRKEMDDEGDDVVVLLKHLTMSSPPSNVGN